MFIHPIHSTVLLSASYVLVTRQVHGTSTPLTSRWSSSITQNGANMNLFIFYHWQVLSASTVFMYVISFNAHNSLTRSRNYFSYLMARKSENQGGELPNFL